MCSFFNLNPTPTMAPKSTPAKGPTGPTYYDLIKAAIAELKDRTGSSRHAISKVVSSKKATFDNKALNRALKAGVESGKLVQVKASYKLSAAEKKPVKKAKTVKKPAAKKKTVTKKTAAKKTPAKKKTVTKKAPAKKATATKKKASSKKPAAKKKATTTKSKAKTTSKKK